MRKFIKAVFLFLGTITSLLLVLIDRYAGDTWTGIIVFQIIVAIFSYTFLYFIKQALKKQEKLVDYLFYTMTAIELYLCCIALVNKTYLETSSQIVYVGFFVGYFLSFCKEIFSDKENISE